MNTKLSLRWIFISLVSATAGLIPMTSQAGLTVNIHTYRFPGTFVAYPWLTTNATPPAASFGDYLIRSTNGTYLQYRFDTNGFNYIGGGGVGTASFSDFMNTMTNGQWSIQVTNASSTNTYFFRVTASGLNSNLFDMPTITFPSNDAVNVTNNPTFTWAGGPTGWLGNIRTVSRTPNYSYYQPATLPPSATSWNTPNPPLPVGDNIFEFDYYSNATATVVASIPRDAGSNAISGWVSIATLTVNPDSVAFNVGLGNAFDAYLVGRYNFENTNAPGDDTSGNNNHANCSSSGGPNDDIPSTNAVVDAYSRQFFGDTYICYEQSGSAFPNLSNAISGNFTVTAWVKTTNSVGFNNDHGYGGMSVWFADGFGTNYTEPLSITGSKAAFTVYDQNGDPTTVHSTNSVNNGVYRFIAVTRHRSSGLMSMYVDGQLEATQTGSTAALKAATYFGIAGGNYNFAGLLDDVRIYSTNLSAGDIAILAGIPIAGTLTDALDATNLTWTTGGNAPWSYQTTNTHDTVDAARSGVIGHNQSSWIETTVTGPGTFSFWWRASSDDNNSYDYVELTVNGNYYDELSGDSGWISQGYNFGAGNHTVRWTYYKDSTDVDFLDAAFLDEVSFVPDTIVPIVITRQPVSQTNSPGYQVGLLAAATSNAAITWQWYKQNSFPVPVPSALNLVPGATNALFIPTDSGSPSVGAAYFAIASNSFGSATTVVALVVHQATPLSAEWNTMFKSPFSTITAGSIGNMNEGDFYLACAVDGSNNLYAAGQFYGNHLINSTNTLRTINPGACLVKHTTAGGTLWAAGVTNNGNGQSYAVAVATASDGGVYVVGNFTGTNWLGTNLLVAAGGNNGTGDIFLARYSANGSNVWVKTISSTNSDFALLNSLAADSAGNVTVAGLVSAPANYAGTNVASSGQINFLAQFNSSGSPRWVQIVTNCFNLSLTSFDQRLYAVGQNGAGGNPFHFGGQSVTTDRRWILNALNPTNGQSYWLRGFGPHRTAENPLPLSDDVPRFSVSGTNILIVGTAYSNSATFGAITVNFPTNRAQYFARYDTNGTAHVAKNIGSDFTSILSLVADAAGNSYCAGDFENYTDFGGRIVAGYPRGRTIATPSYFSHGFIAKLDLNGNTSWIRPGIATASYLGYNNANYANFRSVARTPDGRVWAAGLMWGQANFNTNLLTGDIEIISSQAFPVRTAFIGAVSEIVGSAPVLPVTLLNPNRTGGNFQFQFLSQTGKTNTVQSRTNLSLGVWLNRTNILGDGTTKTVVLPVGSSPTEFFRVSTQ